MDQLWLVKYRLVLQIGGIKPLCNDRTESLQPLDNASNPHVAFLREQPQGEWEAVGEGCRVVTGQWPTDRAVEPCAPEGEEAPEPIL